MTIIDPIADMFTRIRNGLLEKHETTVMPFSKIKVEIAKILKNEGFIKSYEVLSKDLVKKQLQLDLKYTEDGSSVISQIKRVSKCGKRVYVPKKRVPKVLNGFGLSIVSTSKGVLSGKDARINNVGGELIGEVY